jgi:hypothetical protein
MAMAQALLRKRCGLRVWLTLSGDNAKGVRAKFRYAFLRIGEVVFLNFDLTPFAPICS